MHPLRAPLAALLLALVPTALRGAAAPEAPLRCDADALPLAGELSVAFSPQAGGRTRLDGRFRAPVPPGGRPDWLHVVGQVTRGEHRVESFRVDWRTGDLDGPLEVPFVRLLPTGHYELAITVTAAPDAVPARCFDDRRALDVPTAGPVGEPAGEPALRLLPFPDRLLTGKTRFEAQLRAGSAAAVAFELDGRRVMTRTRSPWSVELDLGPAPRLHEVAAVALDSEGSELARDTAPVNAGPHRFAVRLALSGASDGPLEADAAVDLPEGATLDRVEFEVDEELRVVLHQPPWRTPLPRTAGGRPAGVRAVAFLSGGGAAEAFRLADGAGFGEQLDVDFVELLATVTDRRGRPVLDLEAGEVVVREDGRVQSLRRFERVEDVPIHAAVMLDISASMVDDLPAAERAAFFFFQSVLTPRDRVAVITFGDRPRLATRFTGSIEQLAGGLADLEISDETALHDSIAFALHYFSGLGGKRALVLISDGADSASRMSFEEVLDYARRTGVTIYSIGLDVPAKPHFPGMTLDRLAAETGGRSFRISETSRLGPIFEAIERELRSQYRLSYQSDASGGEAFRRIDIDVRRSGVTARSAAGYYP